MSQFSPESLSRLLKNVDRAVLVEAIDLADLWDVFGSFERQVLIDLGEARNAFTNIVRFGPALLDLERTKMTRTWFQDLIEFLSPTPWLKSLAAAAFWIWEYDHFDEFGASMRLDRIEAKVDDLADLEDPGGAVSEITWGGHTAAAVAYATDALYVRQVTAMANFWNDTNRTFTAFNEMSNEVAEFLREYVRTYGIPHNQDYYGE